MEPKAVKYVAIVKHGNTTHAMDVTGKTKTEIEGRAIGCPEMGCKLQKIVLTHDGQKSEVWNKKDGWLI